MKNSIKCVAWSMFVFCILIIGLVACSSLANKDSAAHGDRSTAMITDTPKCVGVGTKSEAWQLSGQPDAYDNCKDRHIECTQNGWTSYAKINPKFLAYANCAQEKELPKCVGIGTKSESWKIPGKHIIYDNCADKVVECENIGTKSEAWVAFEKDDPRVIFTVACSDS